jgi:HlyD family secretion protein
MIVKAGVNEVDIGKVRVGMPVKVTLDAYPKTSFAGKVDRIAPAVRIDDKVRVFDIEVRLDAQGRELRSGMTANIEMSGERKDKVLTVPVESVFQRDEGEVVYVKKKLDAKALAEATKKKKDDDGKIDKDAWKKFFDKRVVVTGLSDKRARRSPSRIRRCRTTRRTKATTKHERAAGVPRGTRDREGTHPAREHLQDVRRG